MLSAVPRPVSACASGSPPEAHAANTERALRADVTIFTTWCSDAGVAALPAAAATVAAVIDAIGGTAGDREGAALCLQHRHLPSRRRGGQPMRNPGGQASTDRSTKTKPNRKSGRF